MANRQTALITGASSGIGLELAKVFAGHGYALVLVARSKDALERAAAFLRSEFDVAVFVVALDLSDSSAPKRLFDVLKKKRIAVDVLVNNAGFGLHGEFVDTDLKTELSMIQVNVSALTALCKWFVGPMAQKGRGRILNVASTAAFQPGPFMAVYYASKAYVLSFSEALSEELRGTGVTVTALCPGPTRTQFQRQARLGTNRLFSGPLVMDASDVARIGFKALMRGKPVVVTGFLNKLFSEAVRFTPRRVVRRLVRKVQERR
ncbi:SDR family oxidoreductase [Candidatus Micrarchaeota archaeon]|nr:SDR family oxidoreductase [Candidatus Micrarchaeota archaeon]